MSPPPFDRRDDVEVRHMVRSKKNVAMCMLGIVATSKEALPSLLPARATACFACAPRWAKNPGSVPPEKVRTSRQ